MSRILIAGLQRSGTTWLGEIVGSAPDMTFVNEPDNAEVEPLAYVLANRMGPYPYPAPGERHASYRRLFTFAFAGGWHGKERLDRIRRWVLESRLPGRIKGPAYASIAWVASTRPTVTKHQAIKVVLGWGATEWIAREFDPRVVVVWRHPLNMVPAWQDRGWPKLRPSGAVSERLEGTAVWPPPAEEGTIRAIAWRVCAESVRLLEMVDRHKDWMLVSHEKQCLDPPAGFRELFARLDLDWSDRVRQRLEASDRPGKDYATNRIAADEPLRWRSRLDRTEQDDVRAIIDRFEEVSPTAGAVWRSSPAVASDRQI